MTVGYGGNTASTLLGTLGLLQSRQLDVKSVPSSVARHLDLCTLPQLMFGGWDYGAESLIDIIAEKGLVPPTFDMSLTGLDLIHYPAIGTVRDFKLAMPGGSPKGPTVAFGIEKIASDIHTFESE